MSFEKAEEVVRRLPQVVGCRFHVRERGELLEVVVAARAGSDPAEIVLNVVTALGTQALLDIEEEQVHVVVMPNENEQSSDLVLEEVEYEGRVRFLTYNLRVSEERTLAEVELAHGTAVALGRAESHGAGSAPELLAAACLDALEKLALGRVSLRLTGFQQISVGNQVVVCVVVQETEGRHERTLVGTARTTGDASRAGAYAALSSMNRRMGRILAGPPRDYSIE